MSQETRISAFTTSCAPTPWEHSGTVCGPHVQLEYTFMTLSFTHKSFSPHSAFNNILSNLGYVMLGLLFLLIVLRRDIVHNRALVRNELNAVVRHENTNGVAATLLSV